MPARASLRMRYPSLLTGYTIRLSDGYGAPHSSRRLVVTTQRALPTYTVSYHNHPLIREHIACRNYRWPYFLNKLSLIPLFHMPYEQHRAG